MRERKRAKDLSFGLPYGVDPTDLRRLHLRLAEFFSRAAVDSGGASIASAMAEAYHPENVYPRRSDR